MNDTAGELLRFHVRALRVRWEVVRCLLLGLRSKPHRTRGIALSYGAPMRPMLPPPEET